jgi:hypothetical protein
MTKEEKIYGHFPQEIAVVHKIILRPLARIFYERVASLVTRFKPVPPSLLSNGYQHLFPRG